MVFLNKLLCKRRSIRKFKDIPISDEDKNKLKEALLRAPSSRSLDPWSFIFVDDRVLLTGLAECKEHGAGLIKNAALAVVIAADPSLSDVWIEDCSVASTILHLTASDLNIGSCWVQIRNRKTLGGESSETFVKKILAIPESFKVLSVVALGYADEIKEGHEYQNLKHERISFNRYKNE